MTRRCEQRSNELWIAAQLRGDIHYFTGIPCVNGHSACRWVSNRQCTDCDAERKRKTALAKRANRPDNDRVRRGKALATLMRELEGLRATVKDLLSELAKYDKSYAEGYWDRQHARSTST